MQARLSYVVDTIIGGISEAPYVKYDDVIPGVLHKISALPHLEEVNYRDVIGGFFVVVRAIMGFATTPTSLKLEVGDFLQNMALGIGNTQMQLPDEISGFDVDKVNNLISILWTMRVIERVATAQFGSVENRIDAIKTVKKYQRQDAFDESMRIGVSIASIAYESLLDVGAMLKHFAQDEKYFYTDIEPKRLRQYNKFVFEHMAQYANTTSPMTHPRFLNEPAHVINHTVNMIVEDFDFVMSDDTLNNAKTFISIENFDQIQYFKSHVLQGTAYGDERVMSADFRVLTLATEYMPQYRINLPLPRVMSTDLIKSLSRIMPYSQVQATGWWRRLSERGKIVVTSTIHEF